MTYTHAKTKTTHPDFLLGETLEVLSVEDDMVVVKEPYNDIVRSLPIETLELYTEKPEKTEREKAIAWWKSLHPAFQRGFAKFGYDQKMLIRPYPEYLTGREVEILWNEFVKRHA